MPGRPVHIDRPPFNARLLAWGRATDGWWGLVQWSQTVRTQGVSSSLSVAAWIPAGSIRRPNWAGEGPSELLRITLGAQRAQWPAPAAWPGWFAGAWADGRVPLPEGAEADNGPAWRRR